MRVTCKIERRIKSETTGFTLLEVVVALLILSTVLTSSLKLVQRYADDLIKIGRISSFITKSFDKCLAF